MRGCLAPCATLACFHFPWMYIHPCIPRPHNLFAGNSCSHTSIVDLALGGLPFTVQIKEKEMIQWRKRIRVREREKMHASIQMPYTRVTRERIFSNSTMLLNSNNFGKSKCISWFILRIEIVGLAVSLACIVVAIVLSSIFRKKNNPNQPTN